MNIGSRNAAARSGDTPPSGRIAPGGGKKVRTHSAAVRETDAAARPFAGVTVTFPRGRLTLDGERAVQYARVRSCDDDLERARRQQLVVSALKDKVVSWSALPAAPWRGARMVRAMSTDLSATDLVKLGWLQGRLETSPEDRDVLAGEPTTIGGGFYFLLDPDRAEEQIRRFTASG